MRCRNHDSVSYYFKALTWDFYGLAHNLVKHLICDYY